MGLIKIKIYKDEKCFNEYSFNQKIIKIGSDKSNDLILDDMYVSKHHALIEEINGVFLLITDLNSKNGVKLNNEVIYLESLRHNDVVQIGSFTLTFHFNQSINESQANIIKIDNAKKILGERLNVYGFQKFFINEGKSIEKNNLKKEIMINSSENINNLNEIELQILNFIRTNPFRVSINKISENLFLSKDEVTNSIRHLIDMKLIRQDKRDEVDFIIDKATFYTVPSKRNKIDDMLKKIISFPNSLKVFLCYSSDDKLKIRSLYRQLITEKIDLWFDEEKLLPGQDWSQEINKAVRSSDVVIVCLSQNSVNKKGYVQKEIKAALDVADEQPEGTIFIIPLKLEECDVPERLRKWQWVNYFEEHAYSKLIKTLIVCAKKLGVDGITKKNIKITSKKSRKLKIPKWIIIYVLVPIGVAILAGIISAFIFIIYPDYIKQLASKGTNSEYENLKPEVKKLNDLFGEESPSQVLTYTPAKDIAENEYLIKNMIINISPFEVQYQTTRCINKISFEDAFRSAMTCIFENTDNREGDYNIDYLEKNTKKSELLKYLDRPDTVLSLVPFGNYYSEDYEDSIKYYPEYNELVELNWIFYLNIDSMPEHLWIIVDRSYNRDTYIYGFN